MQPSTRSALLAALLAGLTSQASAVDDRWYLSPMLGYVKPDDKLGADESAALGLGLGKAVSERWNVELGVWGSNLDRDTGKDVDLLGVGVDALYFFNRNADWSPYAVMGLGMFHSDHPGDKGYHLGASAGLGIAKALSNDMSLRADARYRAMETDMPGAGSTLGDWLVNIGLTIPLGPKPAARPAKPAVAMSEAPAAPPESQAAKPVVAVTPAATPAATPMAAPVAPAPAQAAPADSDADGVADSLDKCPATPAGRKVNAEGCEPDSDGDGVVDALDQCADTPKGDKVDAKGCTVLEPIVLKGVNFDSDSARLRPESTPVLDKAAETLKRYPHISVEVAGHTDSTHTDTHNQKLSEERAKSVCDYFIQKGIEAQRLRARGYGEAQPAAENATPAGRETNRRVEILIEEQRK